MIPAAPEAVSGTILAEEHAEPKSIGPSARGSHNNENTRKQPEIAFRLLFVYLYVCPCLLDLWQDFMEGHFFLF